MRTYTKLLCAFLLTSIFFSEAQDIQKVRVDFQNSEGYTRQLLLGFVSDNMASDGVDYGYDAPNIEDLSDDLNWMIEDNRYIIQGVGDYNSEKYYPFGMFLSNSGDISISLNRLENFDSPIDVYLYDLELNTYTLLNATDFTQDLSAANYLNRFFITFSSTIGPTILANSVLSSKDDDLENLKIWSSNSTDQVFVKGITGSAISSIALYTTEGKKIIEDKTSFKNSNEKFALSTSNISTGIYILRIDSATFSHTEKVCITN